MLNLIISNPILLEIIEKGFEVIIRKGEIVLDGFYKSGTIRLEPREDGTFIAHSRYNQTDDIESFDDLVYLNYEWWQSSKTRSELWKNPNEQWSKEMIRIGLVKRREETVVHYE